MNTWNCQLDWFSLCSPFLVSWCQFDSVFWTSCDNGGICNPHVDSPLLIMHYYHKLTIHLGRPIHKKPDSSGWNAASNSGSLADGKAVICFLLSASPARRAALHNSQSNTDWNEQKILEMEKIGNGNVWFWKSIKLTCRTERSLGFERMNVETRAQNMKCSQVEKDRICDQ